MGRDPGQHLPIYLSQKCHAIGTTARAGGGSRCQSRCQHCLRAGGSLRVLFPLCNAQHRPQLLLLLASEGHLSFLLVPPMPTLCCCRILHHHRDSLHARSIHPTVGTSSSRAGSPRLDTSTSQPVSLAACPARGMPTSQSQSQGGTRWHKRGTRHVLVSPLTLPGGAFGCFLHAKAVLGVRRVLSGLGGGCGGVPSLQGSSLLGRTGLC